MVVSLLFPGIKAVKAGTRWEKMRFDFDFPECILYWGIAFDSCTNLPSGVRVKLCPCHSMGLLPRL